MKIFRESLENLYLKDSCEGRLWKVKEDKISFFDIRVISKIMEL